MNKVLRMSLLALATVALMGSCKKKGGNEPTPTPAVSTTPASEITLTIPAGQRFTLAGLEGENLSVGGENVVGWAYTPSAPQTREFTAVNGSVVIKGNVRTLTFAAGTFTKLEVPRGLESLALLNGTTTRELDLRNVTSLKRLRLDNVGLTGEQNLTHLTGLEVVNLKNAGARFTLPSSVKSLTLNEHGGVANDLTLAAFPNLESLYLIGSYMGKNVDFTGSTKLKTFGNSRSNAPQVVLKNCSALANVLLRDMNGTTSVDLSGCPLLKEGTVASVNSFKGFATNLDSPRLATLNLAGASLTNFNSTICTTISLVSLDLSGNKLTAANFSGFGSLTSLNLLNNPTLTGVALSDALRTLPATNGTIKITGLSASDAAIVAQRGWTVAQ